MLDVSIGCKFTPEGRSRGLRRASLGCGLPSRMTCRVILRFLVHPLASSCSVHTSGTSTVRGGRGAPPPNLPCMCAPMLQCHRKNPRFWECVAPYLLLIC